MDNLVAARLLMALSLAFHIVFAAIGMAMPLLMVLAEGAWLRTGDDTWRVLARRWSRGVGILFAVGAVSGTVLSFEMGLLFPGFMRLAGPVVGMPFSLEGFAFFAEAIFLGIYLYGWDRVSRGMHLFAGAMVAVAGVCSAAFVVTANAWMNAPTGFTFENGTVTSVDILQAMLGPAAVSQVIHMVLAAYVATSFGVAGVHAWLLRKHRDSDMNRKAFKLAAWVGSVAVALQMLSGHESAVTVFKTQPAKGAAMEALWETQACAPMEIGGYSSDAQERVSGAIRIPCALSLLLAFRLDLVVKGLKDFPPQDRPPSGIVHLAFDVMVTCGTVLMLLALAWWFVHLRKINWWEKPLFLLAYGVVTPLGFVALESGWVVTEVGRQPWVIQGVLRTRDAVTEVPDVGVPLFFAALLYGVLGFTVAMLMRAEVLARDDAPGGHA